jgi:hypothetical protein
VYVAFAVACLNVVGASDEFGQYLVRAVPPHGALAYEATGYSRDEEEDLISNVKGRARLPSAAASQAGNTGILHPLECKGVSFVQAPLLFADPVRLGVPALISNRVYDVKGQCRVPAMKQEMRAVASRAVFHAVVAKCEKVEV